MAFSDYSTTPSLNVTIAGINVGEGCPPANINNAIRQIMADGKTLNNTVSGLSSGMPVTGGVFTGPISQSGKGAYVYWDSSAQSSGKIFIQASGGAAPTMANGDILLEY